MVPAPTQAPAKKRILIIEDDHNLNQSLGRKFTRLGFEVTGCHDGQEGIEHLSHETFDCVLLDLMMPIKDGFAVLTKKPATLNASIPAYVLTGLGQDEKLALARELGAKHVFSKHEVSPADVAATIEHEVSAVA
jgi:DNA-binding response OmpR family regulator